jgi:hypothetical protein
VEPDAEAKATKAQMLANNPDLKPQPTRSEAMKEVAATKPREDDGTFKKDKTPLTANGHTRTRNLSSNSAERIVRRLKRDAALPKAPNHERAKAALEKKM